MLHLPLPDRYRGAFAAAQMKLGCKSQDADLDPGVLLALVPAGVDIDDLRTGIPRNLSCVLDDVEQQLSAWGAAVVINIKGQVLTVWQDLVDSGAVSLDASPTITIASGKHEDIESAQDMLKGQRVYFDTLEIIDLDTGVTVTSYALSENNQTDDDDDD